MSSGKKTKLQIAEKIYKDTRYAGCLQALDALYNRPLKYGAQVDLAKIGVGSYINDDIGIYTNAIIDDFPHHNPQHMKMIVTKSECESLLDEFMSLELKQNNGKMDRSCFRDLLHNSFDMTDDILMDRVFRAFDRDNDSYIGQEEWVKGLSVTLRGCLAEKTKFAFAVYDLNSDGFISREEMFQLLKETLYRQPNDEDPDEGVRDLVEITFKKLDVDHDGKVSFENFESAVAEEPLLLEVLGPCLPDEKAVCTFLSTFQEIEVSNLISYINPRERKCAAQQ